MSCTVFKLPLSQQGEGGWGDEAVPSQHLTPNSLSLLGEGAIFGIETSCDETSAAVLRNGELASVVVSSQFFHDKFGGVVPELASRAHVQKHHANCSRGVDACEYLARQDLDSHRGNVCAWTDGIASRRPEFRKGLSLGLNIPLIGIHHIEAHIFSALLEKENPILPFIALVVSGGHTLLILVKDVGSYEFLGETLTMLLAKPSIKSVKCLGLDYPAGPEIDKLATRGQSRVR